MKICLIQIDGKLPNLALMKLSAYHKSLGDKVYLLKTKEVSSGLMKFDKVYISCIFEENRKIALDMQRQFDNAELGGIGVNDVRLNDEIEHVMPDYDLYRCDYSMGFTTRGCIRNCKHCKVRKHEGLIRENCDIYEFWDKRHTHIVLMDNNILALPKHFKKISEQIMSENLTVDFNQGMDIRILNDENTEILSRLRVRPRYRFAFDSMDVEKDVVQGIELLKKYKIRGSAMLFYVLVGFNTTVEQDLYRLNLLKKNDIRTYVMRYKTCRGIRIYNDMASWSNQMKFFMSMNFDTFRKCVDDRDNLIIKKKKKNVLLSDFK